MQLQASTIPMPGDAVMIIGEQPDCLKSNPIGIIGGTVNHPKDDYSVTFNLHKGAAFRGKSSAYSNKLEVVECSGGPSYLICRDELIYTGATVNATFWRWQDVPRAYGGENYVMTVPLWLWKRTQPVQEDIPFACLDESERPLSLIKRAIETYTLEGFIESHVQTSTSENLRLEALGVLVSQFCNWSGNLILKVALEAMDDANFRTEAEQLREMLRKIEVE